MLKRPRFFPLYISDTGGTFPELYASISSALSDIDFGRNTLMAPSVSGSLNVQVIEVPNLVLTSFIVDTGYDTFSLKSAIDAFVTFVCCLSADKNAILN